MFLFMFVCPQGPGGGLCPGGCLHGYHPAATAVVGTHPTGMHSCYKIQEKLILILSCKTGVHHAALYNGRQFPLYNRKLKRKLQEI